MFFFTAVPFKIDLVAGFNCVVPIPACKASEFAIVTALIKITIFINDFPMDVT